VETEFCVLNLLWVDGSGKEPRIEGGRVVAADDFASDVEDGVVLSHGDWVGGTEEENLCRGRGGISATGLGNFFAEASPWMGLALAFARDPS
jgi:hypothetical protein